MDAILKSHFLALYCMVLADGIIEANELEVLYRIGRENYGLAPTEILEAVRDGGTSFRNPEDLKGKIRILYDMAQIAWADGTIDESERQLLKKYVTRLGFMEQNVDGITDFILQNVGDGKSFEEIICNITEE